MLSHGSKMESNGTEELNIPSDTEESTASVAADNVAQTAVESVQSSPDLRLFGLREEVPRWLTVVAGLTAVTLCAGLWLLATNRSR